MNNLTPQTIFDRIATSGSSMGYTYIITGKNGPTGKSWLYRKLREYGYNAIEINEDILRYGHIEFNDNENHCVINGFDSHMLIILNERVEGYR